MSREEDPATMDDTTTGGASGGGHDPRDNRLPDTPTETSDQRGKFPWPGGARPKNPYAY